ncbi:hypothetical protein BC829DRAFT_114588 [Chytridium lagenaria]|nr:hypothetical protein BC829DRAFT_114588 [Chytridium lagenaria]
MPRDRLQELRDSLQNTDFDTPPTSPIDTTSPQPLRLPPPLPTSPPRLTLFPNLFTTSSPMTPILPSPTASTSTLHTTDPLESSIDHLLQTSTTLDTLITHLLTDLTDLERIAPIVSVDAEMTEPIMNNIDGDLATVRMLLKTMGDVPNAHRREDVRRMVALRKAGAAKRVLEVVERYRRVKEMLKERCGGIRDIYRGVANSKEESVVPSTIFAQEMLTHVSTTRSFAPRRYTDIPDPVCTELVRTTAKRDMLEHRHHELIKLENRFKSLLRCFQTSKI